MAKRKPKGRRGPPAQPVKPGSWADRLRKLRAKLDLTQAEMAARIGVATRTLIAWENAQTVPSGPSAALLRLTFPTLA